MESNEVPEYLENELERIDRVDPNAGYPEPPEKENILKTFWKLVTHPVTTKFGNLTSKQIGESDATILEYMNMATFSSYFAKKDNETGEIKTDSAYFIVGNYLNDKAENARAISLSKDGMFVKLPFTQIKSLNMGNKKGDSKPKGFFDRFKSDKPQVNQNE